MSSFGRRRSAPPAQREDLPAGAPPDHDGDPGCPWKEIRCAPSSFSRCGELEIGVEKIREKALALLGGLPINAPLRSIACKPSSTRRRPRSVTLRAQAEWHKTPSPKGSSNGCSISVLGCAAGEKPAVVAPRRYSKLEQGPQWEFKKQPLQKRLRFRRGAGSGQKQQRCKPNSALPHRSRSKTHFRAQNGVAAVASAVPPDKSAQPAQNDLATARRAIDARTSGGKRPSPLPPPPSRRSISNAAERSQTKFESGDGVSVRRAFSIIPLEQIVRAGNFRLAGGVLDVELFDHANLRPAWRSASSGCRARRLRHPRCKSSALANSPLPSDKNSILPPAPVDFFQASKTNTSLTPVTSNRVDASLLF